VKRCAIIAFLLLATFASGCSSSTPVTAGAVEKPFPVPANSYTDDVGRFLAGVPGRTDGPFHHLESDTAWRWHSHEFQRMWSKYEAERLPLLRSFQQKEISGKQFASSTLFYPFGGPDVLTAAAFFPQRKTYLLVGLEPPGTLPDSKVIREGDLAKYLPRIQLTLDSVLRRSFFITANMDVQVRGQITDGLLPLLLAQLALMKATIVGYAPVTLDASGKLEPRVEERRPASSLRNDGVAIDFRLAGETETRQLLYFSVNLNDSALPANEAFRKYLQGLQPVTTFFKSASYLPHRKDFSQIRQLVLDSSNAIVQDDTGIPYRFIDQTRWQVRLFGQYTKPYGSFKFMVQPDLRKAYEEGNAQPLDFFIGYGYKRAPSAMQVFARKG